MGNNFFTSTLLAANGLDEMIMNFRPIMIAIFSVVGVAGTLYAVFLAVSLAKSKDDGERKKAKKRIMMVISSMLVVVMLTAMLLNTTPIGNGPKDLVFSDIPTNSRGQLLISVNETVPLSTYYGSSFVYDEYSYSISNTSVAELVKENNIETVSIRALSVGTTSVTATRISKGWHGGSYAEAAPTVTASTVSLASKSSPSVVKAASAESRTFELRVIDNTSWAQAYPYEICFHANGGVLPYGRSTYVRTGLTADHTLTYTDLMGIMHNGSLVNNTSMVSRPNHDRIAWTAIQQSNPNSNNDFSIPTNLHRIAPGTTIQQMLSNPAITRQVAANGVTTMNIYAFWKVLTTSQYPSAPKPAPAPSPSPTPSPETPPSTSTGKIVVLDAGHGGTASGATGALAGTPNRLEKTDTLKMATTVGDILRKKNITVIYTRTTDKDVSLSNRVSISNTNKADLFVSIHRDAFSSSQPNGPSSWIRRSPSTQETLLANNIHSRIKAMWTRPEANLNRGIQNSNFTVLTANAPAILLELGFISNSQDNAFFDSKFNDLAAAIASGIITTLNAL